MQEDFTLRLKCWLVAKTKEVVCTRTCKPCYVLNGCIHTDTARQAMKDSPLLSPWSLLRRHLGTQKELPQLLPSLLLSPSLHHLPAGTPSCWQCMPVCHLFPANVTSWQSAGWKQVTACFSKPDAPYCATGTVWYRCRGNSGPTHCLTSITTAAAASAWHTY